MAGKKASKRSPADEADDLFKLEGYLLRDLDELDDYWVDQASSWRDELLAGCRGKEPARRRKPSHDA